MAKNLFDLTGKVALITGGNGGIGLGFAEGVAKQGADVCIWGRNAQKNSEVLAQLTEFGTKVHAVCCDVADEVAVENAFAETLDVFGRVDGCFANAGVAKSGRFEEFSTEDWRHVMDVNLDGLFYTLRCAAKHMKQRAEAGDPGGRLIATSSLGALMGMARVEAYGASKGAVISMMQGLAVEYARWGVTANSILPGHIETAMTKDNYANEKFANAILPRIPARRWGDRSDFEGIAAYLMSDASSYHTGDSLLIDGGFFLY
ncbi:MAG: NAD(P)-dependent dehydrogenase (short-subunit alcohol dehydrogenase family) [Kiritimatiellia bacterium]|jgi:NAD(P)-dependent dehydrogenase (short-subunit alcohol dehydrogenase family)